MTENNKPIPQLGNLGTGEYFARRTGLPWAMPSELGTDANDLHRSASLPACRGSRPDAEEVKRHLSSMTVGFAVAHGPSVSASPWVHDRERHREKKLRTDAGVLPSTARRGDRYPRARPPLDSKDE